MSIVGNNPEYRRFPSCDGAHPVTFSIEAPRTVGVSEYAGHQLDRLFSWIDRHLKKAPLTNLTYPSWQSVTASQIRQHILEK